MPKAAPKKHSADAITAVHPYAKSQFKFGSPKKAAGAVAVAATPGATATKPASGGGGAMRAPSLQAANKNYKHSTLNNFQAWDGDKMANFLQYTVENGVPKVGMLVKAAPWANKRGETVQPKQPWKLDQYGKNGQYFDALLKIFQVYNNTDTPGNTKKLTFRAHFVKEDDPRSLDHKAAKNFKSFVDSFQRWAYEHRDKLPWQWSKGAKSIAKKLKEIAAETDGASFDEITTDPKWQKYKTKTNEDTGEDFYLNWDKEEIGMVKPEEPPPAGAVVIGNKFFPNRVKKDRDGNFYVEFDMNYEKYHDVVDVRNNRKSISLTDITEGSLVCVRGIQTLYALNEQQIVGGVPKLPMGRNPKLEVIQMNPEGRKLQPDKSAAGGASSDGGASSNNNAYAYHEEQMSSLAERIAARMAGDTAGK